MSRARSLSPLAETLRNRQRALQERVGLVKPEPEHKSDDSRRELWDAQRDAARADPEAQRPESEGHT